MEAHRLNLARWELEAAHDELRSLLANVAAGVYRKALHNLYFAAFHAVRAHLAAKGIETRTHNAVQMAFSLHFVKPGAVSKGSAKALSELQAARERADYQVELSYDEQDVRRFVALADPLMDELLRLAKEIRGLRATSVAASWREVAGRRKKRAAVRQGGEQSSRRGRPRA